MNNFIIADFIRLIHILSYSILIISPLFDYISKIYFNKIKNIFIKEKLKYHNNGFLFLVIFINITTLSSWYIKDNICIISEYENFYNPNKYKVIIVDLSIILTTVLNLICNLISVNTNILCYKTNINFFYILFLFFSIIIN